MSRSGVGRQGDDKWHFLWNRRTHGFLGITLTLDTAPADPSRHWGWFIIDVGNNGFGCSNYSRLCAYVWRNARELGMVNREGSKNVWDLAPRIRMFGAMDKGNQQNGRQDRWWWRDELLINGTWLVNIRFSECLKEAAQLVVWGIPSIAHRE